MEEQILQSQIEEKNAPEHEEIPETPEKKSAKSFFTLLFSPKNRIKTIAVMVACLLLVAAVCYTLYYRSPEQVAIRFAKAQDLHDEKAMTDLLAYDYIASTIVIDADYFYERMSDKYNEDIDDWGDYCEVRKSDRIESYKDYYGDFSIKDIHIIRQKDYSVARFITNNLEGIERLEDRMIFDRDSISAGKEITVKYKIEGEYDHDTRSITLQLCKIGSDWKVLSWNPIP